jgi:ERCC4-type nuclease
MTNEEEKVKLVNGIFVDSKDLIVNISSNEDNDAEEPKEIIRQIMSYYPPGKCIKTAVPVGDVVCGRCCLELKTAADLLSSMKNEPGSTTSRLIRQAYNMQQSAFEVKEILVSATMNEIIMEAHSCLDDDAKRRWTPENVWGYMSMIRARFGIPVIPFGQVGLAYYIHGLLSKSNDGKVRVVNPLAVSATSKDQQVAVIQSIKDLGPKVSHNLLVYFGTIQNVMNASIEQLKEVDKIGPVSAKQIYDLSRMQYEKRYEKR